MPRPTRWSRRRVLAGAGVTGVTALAGCSSNSGTTETSTEGTGGTTNGTTKGTTSGTTSGSKTLSLSIPSTDSFDPIKIKGDGSTQVFQQVFSTLTYLEPGSLEPKLLLADDYSVSNDGTRYTFDLKTDVTFHDGSKLTAQDFVYSWERLAASPNAQESKAILEGGFQLAHETEKTTNDNGEQVQTYVPGSLGVKALDKHTLQVDLAKPFFDALYEFSYGALAPVPKGIVGDIDGYDGQMSYETFAQENPVGLGPFTFEDITPGTEVRLSAFDDYVGPRGNVDTIHFQVLNSASAEYHYAMNENVDMFVLPSSKYSHDKVDLTTTGTYGQRQGTYGPLNNGKTVNYGTYPTNYTGYFIFNCNRVERPVRRAVSYVANPQTFLSQAFNGLGQPAYHYTPPSVFPGGASAYTAHAKTGKNAQTKWGQDGYPYGYNETKLGEARSVMEDAGYSQSNPYEMTLSLYTDRKADAYSRIGQILQSQLQSVHVDLSIEKMPFSAIIDGAIKGNLDFFTLGNGLSYPSAVDMLKLVYPYDGNFTHWGSKDGTGPSTPASQAAADAWQTVQNNLGRTDADQQARNEAFLKIEEAAWEDAPAVLNYHPVSQQYWYDDVQTDVRTSSFHDFQYDVLSLGDGN